jgi:hypothetical protein
MKLLLAFALVITCAAEAGAAQCKEVPNSSPSKLVCEVESPMLKGGLGNQWGEWHTLRTAPVPAGYRLTMLSFRLEGPHPCAADVSAPRGTTEEQKVKPPAQTESSTDARLSDISETLMEILESITTPESLKLVAVIPAGVGSWSQCYQSDGGPGFVEWKFRFQGWTSYHFFWDGRSGSPRDVPESITQRAMIQTVWTKEN